MTQGLPKAQRSFAFFAIAIAVSMSVLDSTIVNVALPTITHDLQILPAQAIWIINAYQLAIIISLLPLASLGDSIGYKKIYCTGLFIFTLASALCANSNSLFVLSCARALQGFGAAGVMSVNIALVRFIFPKSQLGRGMGYSSLIVASSSAAGPSIASAILAVAHWQWLFLVNVPLGLLAFSIATRTLPKTPRTPRKLDVTSLVLNVFTFGLLIAGINTFSESNNYDHALIMIVCSVFCGILFVMHERGRPLPILPLDLLKKPVFALSLSTSIGSFAAQMIAFVALPFYFQRDLGYSVLATGLLMTPWPLATALIAPIAGRLSDKFPPERLSALGMSVMAFALLSFAFVGNSPSDYSLIWRLAMCGLGFGLFQSPNNKIIIGSAPPDRSGGASGLQSLGRLLGQSLGAGMVAIIFSLHLANQMVIISCLAAGLALLAACTGGSRRPQL